MALLEVDLLDNLQKQLGYRFKEQRWLIKALTHKSFSTDHNERLEFLGDSILNNVISIKLYELYRDREGSLTNLKSKIVSNENLHRIAQEKLDLEKYIRYKPFTDTTKFIKVYYLADFFEAILGAIYEDSGSQTPVKEVVMSFCWEPNVTEQKLAESFRPSAYSLRQSFNSTKSTSATIVDTFSSNTSIPATIVNNKRKGITPTSTWGIEKNPGNPPTRLENAYKRFKFSKLKPKESTTEELTAQLRSLLAVRRVNTDNIQMVHGKHPKKTPNNQHSVRISIPPLDSVQGFGASLDGAKVNAIKLMIEKVRRYNPDQTRRSPRTSSAAIDPRSKEPTEKLEPMETNVEELMSSDEDEIAILD